MISLFLNAVKKRQALWSASVVCLFTLPAVATEKAPTAQTGSTAQSNFLTELIPSREQRPSTRRSYFTVGIGLRLGLVDSEGISAMRQFAREHIVRPDEVIYKGSGVALAERTGALAFEPALRAEWELPAARISWLSVLWSVEGGYLPAREILSATGNFRFQNPQAVHVALTDLTYTGSLSVTEHRFSLTPMLGLGAENTNTWLQSLQGARLLARVSLGVMLTSWQRQYSLVLNPQFVSAVNDFYVIQSEMMQSVNMAVLPAGRVELGVRLRLSAQLHCTLLFSVTALYGTLAWENQGFFAERAGAAAQKNIYQRIVSGINEQTYFAIMPAIFLALSTEL